jgi:hypothetical protein
MMSKASRVAAGDKSIRDGYEAAMESHRSVLPASKLSGVTALARNERTLSMNVAQTENLLMLAFPLVFGFVPAFLDTLKIRPHVPNVNHGGEILGLLLVGIKRIGRLQEAAIALGARRQGLTRTWRAEEIGLGILRGPHRPIARACTDG